LEAYLFSRLLLSRKKVRENFKSTIYFRHEKYQRRIRENGNWLTQVHRALIIAVNARPKFLRETRGYMLFIDENQEV